MHKVYLQWAVNRILPNIIENLNLSLAEQQELLDNEANVLGLSEEERVFLYFNEEGIFYAVCALFDPSDEEASLILYCIQDYIDENDLSAYVHFTEEEEGI